MDDTSMSAPNGCTTTLPATSCSLLRLYACSSEWTLSESTETERTVTAGGRRSNLIDCKPGKRQRCGDEGSEATDSGKSSEF
ncbi:hypothetical protein M404DRAFT_913862 [Pisolithus tinctorius Marx 270]|uniref:Uncharacterized protein n=1 Tax=Pisolithus tinctorius Marx 270 TaxID=870435 RepID=A0A0C3PNV1_PISTI|nr:hypothetical protein M404DRAFT_913862 [Pisolithus tinctorius Marx 270]